MTAAPEQDIALQMKLKRLFDGTSSLPLSEMIADFTNSPDFHVRHHVAKRFETHMFPDGINSAKLSEITRITRYRIDRVQYAEVNGTGLSDDDVADVEGVQDKLAMLAFCYLQQGADASRIVMIAADESWRVPVENRNQPLPILRSFLTTLERYAEEPHIKEERTLAQEQQETDSADRQERLVAAWQLSCVRKAARKVVLKKRHAPTLM